jgi:hypothetical protein
MLSHGSCGSVEVSCVPSRLVVLCSVEVWQFLFPELYSPKLILVQFRQSQLGHLGSCSGTVGSFIFCSVQFRQFRKLFLKEHLYAKSECASARGNPQSC